MTEEKQRELLQNTRATAIALVEDIDDMRDFLNKTNKTSGEVRRWVSVLRRLLIDADITNLSNPRIGRFRFSAPDNMPVYNAEKKRPYAFFGSGGMTLFGIVSRCLIIEEGHTGRDIPNFDCDRKILLDLGKFLNLPVLCLQGSWISRGDVIKYMANVASGVHSRVSRDNSELIIERLRSVSSYSVKDGTMSISFNYNALSPEFSNFSYGKNNIDPVLAELLATMHCIIESEDLVWLETCIMRELEQPTEKSA